MEEVKMETLDLGFSSCMMPGEKRLMRLAPQRMFKPTRLYIEEVFGVFLNSTSVGRYGAGMAADCPISTLFYSVPTNAETVEKLKKLARALEGREVDYPDILEFVEMKSDPSVMLGLPLSWPTVNIGNTISMEFENRSHNPVRVTGVIRGESIEH